MKRQSKLAALMATFVLIGLAYSAVVPLPSRWGDWQAWGDMGDGTYRNPVLPADYSDLDCIRVGSYYYAISSTMQFCPGMVIVHSKDLVNWEIIGHAVSDTSQIGPQMDWNRMNRYGRGIWAGALRFHDGKFWVYFGTPDEGYFMTTATNAAGPWDPLYCLKNESGWDDCCPFWDDDGQAYFVGTRFADNYKTYIWRMSPDGRTLIESSRTLINEGAGREASKLYKINGWYYHFFSEVLNGTRVVMMQRSHSIMGPYTERRQLTDGNREWREPNQGGLVDTQSGNWFFLTHHGSGDWEGRCMSLLPVTWFDGWPILGQTVNGEPGKMELTGTKPVQGQPVITPQSSDDFSAPVLSPQWEWNYHPRMDKWSLTERPGYLRLKAFMPLRTDDLMTAGNTLTQRSFRTLENVVIAKFDLSGMADGQKAGLCHFAKNHSALGVMQEGSVRRIEFRQNGVLTQGPVIEQNLLWIKSSWGLDGKSQYAYSLDGRKFTPFGSIYQLSWGYYRGDRIGLYCFNVKEDAGFVDVDFLSYDYLSKPDAVNALTGQSPTNNANGVMLGSWNTQVEFDDVKVVCGSAEVLKDSFDTEQSGWRRDSGNWQISGGVCRQTSDATPAVTTCIFHDQGADYTITIRGRKTGGSEGMLVGFGVQDAENYYWLNLGGWNNTAHRLEKSEDGYRQPIGPAVQGSIETGRWYDIKIQVQGRRIQCFLDEQCIIDLTDVGFGDDSIALPSDNDKLNFGRALIPDLAADPSIVDIDGTFYCYATTDGWGQGLATSGTPVVWTSKDFLNWSFEGSSFPPDFDLKYWAPSTVIQKNGRYYSFPTLDGKITAVVADSPLGPFAAPDGKHVTHANHQPFPIEQRHSIDAEVFIDDDGQAYMFWGMHRVVKLKPDLLEPDGPVTTIRVKREGYSEGPYLTKRNGIYYYFYTLGGDEAYQYAYMMSRTSPLGPWEAPEQDIISTTDHENKVFGPGHGCFFCPQDSDQWYFVYLEYGRGGTNRQIYADKMNFNPDGTIQPIKLTKAGVGALRPTVDPSPNLALNCKAAASSTRRNYRVRPRKDAGLDRVETYAAANAIDGYNGTRWLAAGGDSAPWFQVDLGAPHAIRRTEVYFVKPAAGHAYRLESSLDGQSWHPYGGHNEVILRSPHRDEKTVRARYLKLTILHGEPGLWEFRVY